MNIKPDRLSLNQIKYFSSLLTKKGRKKENKFIVEGKRIVDEALKSNFEIQTVIVTTDFVEKNEQLLVKWGISDKLFLINQKDFRRISDTKSPQGIAAVVINRNVSSKVDITDKLIVALENISDPGNLGTILRNCDWFGIKHVIINQYCAELENPKTIRASMGALFHLNIIDDNDFYSSLSELKKSGYQIISSDLGGKDIFKFNRPEKTVVVFSNEAFGPSIDIKNIADYSVTIPRIGNAESLNVASASAVILSQLTKT